MDDDLIRTIDTLQPLDVLRDALKALANADTDVPVDADLRELAAATQATDDHSLFTGSAYRDKYGVAGQSHDHPANKGIAFIGGDVQSAYSKLNSAYEVAANANDDARSEYKKTGPANPSLNIDGIVADLDIALDFLATAAEKAKVDDSAEQNYETLRSDHGYSEADVAGLRQKRTQLYETLATVYTHVYVHKDTVDVTRMVRLD
jgi:hypothetical protein